MHSPLTRLAGFAAFAVLLTAPAARAQPAPPPPTRLAIESHVGERTAEAAAAISPVLDELARRGFATTSAAIAARLGGRLPRPGVLDPGATAADMLKLVERGNEQFVTGSFQDARATLTAAVQRLQRNPGAAVRDPASPEAMFKALVVLARSQARLGDTAASTQTMTELIRAFPGRAVNPGEHGLQAEQLQRAALAQTKAAPRSRLAITASDPAAAIFVDGQRRGTGQLAISDALAGSYRVFVQPAAGDGRQYEIAVRAGEDAALEVDCAAESALRAGESWIGFSFAAEADRARARDHAAQLARHWHADAIAAIAVIGTSVVGGEPAVTAALIGANGEILRAGSVAPGGGTGDARQRALARFLADGTAAPDIAIDGPGAPLRDDPPDWHGRARWIGKGLTGAGIAALITAGILLTIDQDDGHRDASGNLTASFRDTRPAAIGFGIGGAVAIGAGLGLWLVVGSQRDASPPSMPVVSVARSGAVLGWRGRF